MRNVCVAHMLGAPLSVTIMLAELVAGAPAGVQLNCPLNPLIDAVGGAPEPRMKTKRKMLKF